MHNDMQRSRVTAHARSRASQRGVRIKQLDLVEEFGDRFWGPGGATIYFFGRKAAQRAFRMFGVRLERLTNTVAVFAPDGNCVTTYKSNKPLRHWEEA